MRCDMETLISKIATEKLNKRVEVDFSILGGLDDCKRINTKDYIKVLDSSNQEVTTTLAYNKYNKPANLIECGNPDACLNTGSLAVGATTNYIVYRLPYDATKFANGIIIFYVTGFTGSKNVIVKVSDAATFTDMDSYTVAVTGKSGEWTPVVVDLSATPTATSGTGWTPMTTGAYIAINVADAGASISSIAVFDSIEDFENNDVVKMGCITALDGDDEIDAAEATCVYPQVQHDTSSLSFERTITGNAITENYQKLNPLIGKGTAVKAYTIWSQTFTPIADTGYASVTLPDAYTDECGFITAQADCNLLVRYDIPALVAVDEDHFIVMPNSDGTITLYFNSNLAGKEVIISYPRQANVTELIADENNIDKVRVRMFVPYTLTNGKKRAKVYNNVLVTSFTDSVGEDETEFSITVSIQKDASGHYYHVYEYE